MVELIEERRIVFVLGMPHVGKTFSAAAILNHYAPRRTPCWKLAKLSAGEPRLGAHWAYGTTVFNEALMEEIVGDTGKDKTTFVEDPFGKVSRDEVVWNDMGPAEFISRLIDIAGNETHDARIVVTSRDMLFDSALGWDKSIDKLVVRLSQSSDTGRGSYSSSDLVTSHARLRNCKWQTHPEAHRVVTAASSELTTPHSIALFCKASRGASAIKKALSCIDSAARELVTGFANEIVGLDLPHLAFVLVTMKASGYMLPLDKVFSWSLQSTSYSGKKTYLKCAEAMDGRIESETFSAEARDVEYLYAADLAFGAATVRQLLASMLADLKRTLNAMDDSSTYKRRLGDLVHDWAKRP